MTKIDKKRMKNLTRLYSYLNRTNRDPGGRKALALVKAMPPEVLDNLMEINVEFGHPDLFRQGGCPRCSRKEKSG